MVTGHNHWDDSGDLVIEDRTLFRQVGWQGHTYGTFYRLEEEGICRRNNSGGYSPVYIQIATDHGEGWED
jgi:hypothetical protein